MSNGFKVIKKYSNVTPVIFIGIGIYYFEHCLQRRIENTPSKMFDRVSNTPRAWLRKSFVKFPGIFRSASFRGVFNPLSANPTKWSNTQTIFRLLSTFCLSVFDHFLRLVLKGLRSCQMSMVELFAIKLNAKSRELFSLKTPPNCLIEF